jgi:hypothetical protein
MFFERLDAVLRDLGFGGAAFFLGRDSDFALLFFVRVAEVLLDLGFAGAAFFVDSTSAFGPSFFALLAELLRDAGLAEPALSPAAIWDLSFLTVDSALSSFLRVFDSCAFSFFFFIFA